MLELDNRTILFVLIFVGMISTVFSFFPSDSSRKRIMRIYRAANLSYLLGFLLLMTQSILPTFVSVILSNTLIVLGFGLFSLTAVELYGGSIDKKIPVVFMSIHTALFFLFLYVYPSTLYRIIVISIGIIFINILAQQKLIRVKYKHSTPVFRMLQFIQFGYSLLLLFRIFLTILFHQKIESIFSLDLATTVIFMGTIAFHLAMNLIFIITLILQYDEESRGRIQLLENSHHEMTLLNSLQSRVVSKNNLNDLYSGIAEFILHYFSAKAVGIYLKDNNEDKLNLIHITGFPEHFQKDISQLPIDESSISGRSILENKPLIVSVSDYPESSLKTTLIESGLTLIASYPIHTSLGALGTFSIGFSHETDMIKRESAFLHLLCHQMGTILENAQLYESLNTKASTDPLTGILNRRELMLRLKQEYALANRSGGCLSVLIMDLDHFKKINDTYGHDMGDFVLKKFTQLVAGNLREEDIFGRYGGEEFLIILRDAISPVAFETAERIRKKIISSKFSFRESALSLTASIGVSVYDPNSAVRNPEEIITQADMALYQAKQEGRNKTVVNTTA